MRQLQHEPRQRRVLHPGTAVRDDLTGEVEAVVPVLAQAREHRSTVAERASASNGTATSGRRPSSGGCCVPRRDGRRASAGGRSPPYWFHLSAVFFPCPEFFARTLATSWLPCSSISGCASCERDIGSFSGRSNFSGCRRCSRFGFMSFVSGTFSCLVMLR